MEVKPLRVCRICGKEAHSKEELKLFKLSPNGSLYERDNICLQCDKIKQKI